MNSWKNKASIKLLAWILSILSAGIMIASAVGVCFAGSLGVYERREADITSDMHQRVDEIYGTMAMAGRGKEPGTFLKDTNFRYGIVKANHIDKVDLSNPENYVEQNFDTFPSAHALEESKDWNVLHYCVGNNTYYEWFQSIFGYGYYHNGSDFGIISRDWNYDETKNDNAVTKAMVDLPIRGYVYDIDNGIFFYQTDEKYFRVNIVGLPVGNSGEFVDFQYDSSQGQYYNAYKDNCIVPEYYLTLNAFDSTQSNWESWNEVVLDGRSFSHMEIDFVHADEIGDISTEYYSSASNGYLSYLTDTLPEHNGYYHYWVVYQVQEPVVSTAFWTGDLYQQSASFVHFLYVWKYYLIALLVAAGMIWIFSTLIVVITSGHVKVKTESEEGEKKGKYVDKIQGNFLQVIPFDLFSCIMGCLFCCASVGAIVIMQEGLSLGGIAIAMLTLEVAYFIGLIWLADFAVRVKLGKWWRNTILYKMLAWVGRICKKILGKCKKVLQLAAENSSLLTKTVVIVGAISVLELIVIVLTRHAVEIEILFWIFGKILLVCAIVLLLMQAGKLKEAAEKMARGQLNEKVDTKNLTWEFKKHGENLNSIVDGMNCALEERMKSERFKTELITNVSHDIKTPLTSIINYVDLLGKEPMESEKAREYLEVLNRQSSRLKKLIEDLIEASKASTGNLPVNYQQMEMGVFLMQMLGEYEEKLKKADITILLTKPDEEVYVSSDGRHLSRVMDNLLNNICKYAYPGTRAFIDLKKTEGGCIISVKNTSKYPLNMKAEELIERFARGDASRHTEGSGLGLSIAVSLMDLMGGSLRIETDGDLFKVILEL